MRHRPPSTILAWMATLALLSSGAFGVRAGQIVTFVDGRDMVVEAVESLEQTVLLKLEGGGELAIPAARVSHWVPDRGKRPAQSPEPLTPKPVNIRWRGTAGDFAEIIGQAADRHDVDPVLLTAMARVESAFDPEAVSPKGAQGLLQLMPATAERFGVRDAFDASQNVEGGARYLSWLLERFEGQTELALAGYNAGENAVDRYSGIPPYPETQDYVVKVLRHVSEMSGSAR